MNIDEVKDGDMFLYEYYGEFASVRAVFAVTNTPSGVTMINTQAPRDQRWISRITFFDMIETDQLARIEK